MLSLFRSREKNVGAILFSFCGLSLLWGFGVVSRTVFDISLGVSLILLLLNFKFIKDEPNDQLVQESSKE